MSLSDGSNYAIDWQTPLMESDPQGWQKFIASGGDPTKKSSYDNWQLQNQRNTGVADYVNAMADPNASANTARFQGGFDTATGNLQDYLAKKAPALSTNDPYAGRATSDYGNIQSLLTNPNSIKNSAAYQFRFNQGLDALNRQLGAQGLLNSGNRLMDTTKYGQDMASQEYENQFGRLKDLYGTDITGSLGQQNATTGAYNAQSNAWNQRGNLLANVYGTSGTVLNNNTATNNGNRLGWASQYSDISPKPQSWGITNNW